MYCIFKVFHYFTMVSHPKRYTLAIFPPESAANVASSTQPLLAASAHGSTVRTTTPAVTRHATKTTLSTITYEHKTLASLTLPLSVYCFLVYRVVSRATSRVRVCLLVQMHV